LRRRRQNPDAHEARPNFHAPQARAPDHLARILVPLEGSRESSHALDETVQLAHRRQLEILVLHVHSPATVPAFSDHEPHATRAWEQEFLTRYIATPTSASAWFAASASPATR
jgi:hypothetical protein